MEDGLVGKIKIATIRKTIYVRGSGPTAVFNYRYRKRKHKGILAYNGKHKKLDGKVLVRIDEKPSRFRDVEENYAGYFLAQSIPEDFETLDSQNVAFYGIWTAEMRNGFSTPNYEKISRIFNPGYTDRTIHVFNHEGRDFPHSFRVERGKNRPDLIKKEGTKPANIRRSMKKLCRPEYAPINQPRLVTVDENVNIDRVLEAIRNAGRIPFQLEPHL